MINDFVLLYIARVLPFPQYREEARVAVSSLNHLAEVRVTRVPFIADSHLHRAISHFHKTVVRSGKKIKSHYTKTSSSYPLFPLKYLRNI